MRPLFETLGNTPASERAFVRHGLAAWVVDELALTHQPIPVALQQAARAQLASGLKVKRLTHLVLDGLDRRGVVPVLLKGYGLGSRLYPEQPLARPATDVDVWVRSDDLDTAESVLAGLGLQSRAVPGVEDEFEEHHHRAWAGPAGLVEVHFRLFSGFGGQTFEDAAVWARTLEGRLDGRPVRWLGPEDELVYLATHAANHAFLRLSWLVDLARYLERVRPLDWPTMLRRAGSAGFLAPLLAAMELTERLLQVPLPAPVKDALGASRVRRRLHPYIFSADRVVEARWSNDRLASFLLRLYLVDTPSQGARHLVDGARRFWRQRRGTGAQV